MCANYCERQEDARGICVASVSDDRATSRANTIVESTENQDFHYR